MKVVYLRHHTDAKKIIVIASTDTSISAEKIVKLYSRRWNIEVGFHIQKSFLDLASECQSIDYDSQVAFANLSALRDKLIEYKKRTEEALQTLLSLIDDISITLDAAGCLRKSKLAKAKDVI